MSDAISTEVLFGRMLKADLEARAAEEYAAETARRVKELEAERDRLRTALESVRRDCFLRSVPDRDGIQVMPLGRSVWDQVCAALKGEDG